jgi:hypothetical protein
MIVHLLSQVHGQSQSRSPRKCAAPALTLPRKAALESFPLFMRGKSNHHHQLRSIDANTIFDDRIPLYAVLFHAQIQTAELSHLRLLKLSLAMLFSKE